MNKRQLKKFSKRAWFKKYETGEEKKEFKRVAHLLNFVNNRLNKNKNYRITHSTTVLYFNAKEKQNE